MGRGISHKLSEGVSRRARSRVFGCARSKSISEKAPGQRNADQTNNERITNKVAMFDFNRSNLGAEEVVVKSTKIEYSPNANSVIVAND
jgi:hypothetical protein